VSPTLSESKLQEKNGLGRSSGGLALLKAFPTKHRAALRGFEGNCRFPLASRADRLGFDPLVIAPALRQTKRLGALTFAVLTAFWFVLELFVVKKQLLTGGEHEVGATIHALQNLILELH
jgi:hypothetical protein